MSIKSELTKTASYLRNARNAIIGRGGEISLTAGLKDLSDAIYAIPSDAALVYQTEESVAYRKSVPTDVLNFAKVRKVGGMSYKTKNLVDVGTVTFSVYKYVDVFLPATKKYYISTLITSDDTDGTNHQIGLTFDDGSAYYLPFKRNTRSIASTPIFDGKNIIQLTLFAGQNYPTSVGDTATYADVMVCEENTDVYEPYFAGLRHTKVTEMKSEGANLIPFPYVTKSGTMGAGYTTTINGITFTVLDDGKIRANGTATAGAQLSLVKNFVLPKAVVGISGGVTIDGVKNKAYVVVTAGLNDAWVAEGYSIGGKFDLTKYEYDINNIYLYVASGTTLNNAIFEPMVTFYQETPAPYKPYRADNPIGTLAIPEAVQALDGYGESNPESSDEYNYLDFDRMEFFAVGHIVDGVWVRYETPIVTDVTEYFTAMPFIEVEGGGTLTAVNEYEQAAPSTINYITETAGI